MLHHELIDRPEEVCFKDDRKTRVWRVRDADGRPWVIKRWRTHPLRQAALGAVGRHPAQVEARRHAMLAEAGVPAVPVEHVGVEGVGLGRAYWHVTRYVGVSLYNWVRLGRPAEAAARRQAVAAELGGLFGRVFAGGFVPGDPKASNIVIDESDGRLWLIDAGDVRRASRVAADQAKQVLRKLEDNLIDASTYCDDPASVRVNDEDRRVFLGALVKAWPQGEPLAPLSTRSESSLADAV